MWSVAIFGIITIKINNECGHGQLFEWVGECGKVVSSGSILFPAMVINCHN